MAAKDAPSELIRASDVSGFNLWSLPSFDTHSDKKADETAESKAATEPPAVEDLPDDLVKPITLEELEIIRQEAYNEGFSTGERDGFHAGQIKARQEAEPVLAAKLAQLEVLMGHLLAPIEGQDQLLEQALVSLVSQMATQVIQRELQADSSQLTQVLREALKLLPMGAANVRIHIHPQDFELVKALRERHEETWRILEDETLLPGGCRVETAQSQIDATVETRMNLALKQLFDKQKDQLTQPPEADVQIDLEQPDAL
jgi:flagellar assembly protein FliH